MPVNIEIVLFLSIQHHFQPLIADNSSKIYSILSKNCIAWSKISMFCELVTFFVNYLNIGLVSLQYYNVTDCELHVML